MTAADTLNWDAELVEMIRKYFPAGYPPQPPVVPPELTFPFMMVFYRKKVTDRNYRYLAAAAIHNLSDMVILKRNLKHKGWPTMTLMFDLPDFMTDISGYRYRMYWFQNWDDIARILSPADRELIPELKELFPCPQGQVKDKKGQYRLIF
ncbi:MAG: hypothetical protein AB2L20_14965 [Mangrovibacterium sp.]